MKKSDRLVAMKLTNHLELNGVLYQPGEVVELPFRTSQKIIGGIIQTRKQQVQARKDADALSVAFQNDMDMSINKDNEQQDDK